MDGKARDLARSVWSKFTTNGQQYPTGKQSEKQSIAAVVSSGGSIGLLATGAVAMVAELVSLAIQGTPSLYGLNNIG